MAKELEKAGLPTALISALPQIPFSVGALRITRGRAIVHLLGDPALPRAEELTYRRATVEAALRTLTVQVDGPTIFQTAS